MDHPPKIIIVAEREACSSTAAWLARIQLFVAHLHLFPRVFLQIRAKSSPSLRWKALFELSHHPQIILNGTISEYQDASVDIMHIPQSKAPLQKPAFPFGLSIHQATDPQRYDFLQPLYYQLGPIFSPISKKGEGKGCDLIANARLYTKTPIIAVGGITMTSIPQVLHAGADGIASSGYLMQHPNPIEALEKMSYAVES